MKYPEIHISQRAFERTKPYFIRAARPKDRITCCCRYHVEAREVFNRCMTFRKKYAPSYKVYEHLNDMATETSCSKSERTDYHK